MESAHSRLSPSSAAQWIECPASVGLQEKYPADEDSQDTRDGETAHAIGAIELDSSRVYETAPVKVTDEINQAVKLYVMAVIAITNGAFVNIERRVDIGIVHPECFGTPDAWWYDEEKKILHIWDLKFGWGIVDVFRNWQLILPAFGLSSLVPFETVYLHVVQPRAPHREGPVRTWEVSRGSLLDFLPEAKFAAQKVMSGQTDCKTGKHCRYCSALWACDAATRASLNAVDISTRTIAPAPTPHRIGFELMVLTRASDMIKHRLKALEATALSMEKAGTIIPGWQRDIGAGSIVWQPGKDQEILAMASFYGAKLEKPVALITPTQAISAGLPKEVVSMFTEKKPGSAKMVPVNFDKLTEIFGGS